MKTIAEQLETNKDINPWEEGIRYAKLSIEDKIESCENIMMQFKEDAVCAQKRITDLTNELEWTEEKLYDEFFEPNDVEFLKHQTLLAEIETQKALLSEHEKELAKARKLYTELKEKQKGDQTLSLIDRLRTTKGFHEVFEEHKIEYTRKGIKITQKLIFEDLEKKLVGYLNIWHWEDWLSFKKVHYEYLKKKK